MADKVTDFRAEISKGLECSVCMSLLDQPKVLQCHHWFCKTCIDELLEFDNDGSAVINCPMKCKRPTFLENNQTANDLPIPYQLTSLLDVVDSRDKKLGDEDPGENNDISCFGMSNCKNNISMYCSSCSMMFCNQCILKHSKIQHDNKKTSYLPIQFEKRSDKLMVVCEAHSTFAKYVCCKGKFICLYCIHRQHRFHSSTAVQLEAEQMREFLCSDEINFDNLENILENTVKMMQSTQDSIGQSREVLKLSLKNRKLKCMSEYLKLLDKEESSILAKYDTMAADHIKQFPEVITKDYLNNVMKKHDFQIISEREKIMKNIFSFTSTELSVPTIRIDLLDTNYLNKNPLGKLRMEIGSPLIFSELVTSSFQGDYQLYDNAEIALGLLSELKKMVEELLTENKIYEMAHPDSFIIGTHDLEQTSEMYTTSSPEPEKAECSKGELDDFELDETFDCLKEQLCESVDLQFGSLLKAIQDQFIISEGLSLDAEENDSEDSDGVVDEGDDLPSNEEHDNEGDERREDIEQACNQS